MKYALKPRQQKCKLSCTLLRYIQWYTFVLHVMNLLFYLPQSHTFTDTIMDICQPYQDKDKLE